MRNSTSAVLSLVLLIGLSACASGELSDQDRARIEAELEELLAEFASRINGGEWASTIDLYSDDPRFLWVEPGRQRYESKEAVRQAIDAAATMIDAMQISATDARWNVLSKRHAVLVADLRQRFEFSGGGAMEMSGVLTSVLQREETGWKFLVGQVATQPVEQGGE